MKDLNLKIITIDKIVFNGVIKSINAPGTEGSFGILSGHQSMISSLKKGCCRIKRPGGEEISVEITGGLLSIKDNKITVLVDKLIEKN